MDNKDERLITLKELLDAGVITSEEYEAKCAQIEAASKKAEEVKDETHKTDYDELKKIENLLNDGLIDKSEYTQKAAQILGITLVTPVAEKPIFATWLKRNAIAMVLIVALAGALAFVGSRYASMQGEIAKKDSMISSLKSANESLKGYKDAVLDFYIDGAVVYVEGDNTYYHRYGCPATAMASGTFNYLTYNINQAKSAGLKECPTCFGSSAGAYCEAHIAY